MPVTVEQLRESLKGGEAAVRELIEKRIEKGKEPKPYERPEQVQRCRQMLEFLKRELKNLKKEDKTLIINVTRKILEEARMETVEGLRKGADENMQKLREDIESAHSASVDREKELDSTLGNVATEGREVAREIQNAAQEGNWKPFAKYGAIALAGGLAAKWIWNHTIGWLWDKAIGKEEKPGFLRRAAGWVAGLGGAALGAVGLSALLRQPIPKLLSEVVDDAQRGVEKGAGKVKKNYEKMEEDIKTGNEKLASGSDKLAKARNAEEFASAGCDLVESGWYYVKGPTGFLYNNGSELMLDKIPAEWKAVFENRLKGEDGAVELYTEGLCLYVASIGAIETATRIGPSLFRGRRAIGLAAGEVIGGAIAHPIYAPFWVVRKGVDVIGVVTRTYRFIDLRYLPTQKKIIRAVERFKKFDNFVLEGKQETLFRTNPEVQAKRIRKNTVAGMKRLYKKDPKGTFEFLKQSYGEIFAKQIEDAVKSGARLSRKEVEDALRSQVLPRETANIVPEAMIATKTERLAMIQKELESLQANRKALLGVKDAPELPAMNQKIIALEAERIAIEKELNQLENTGAAKATTETVKDVAKEAASLAEAKKLLSTLAEGKEVKDAAKFEQVLGKLTESELQMLQKSPGAMDICRGALKANDPAALEKAVTMVKGARRFPIGRVALGVGADVLALAMIYYDWQENEQNIERAKKTNNTELRRFYENARIYHIAQGGVSIATLVVGTAAMFMSTGAGAPVGLVLMGVGAVSAGAEYVYRDVKEAAEYATMTVKEYMQFSENELLMKMQKARETPGFTFSDAFDAARGIGGDAAGLKQKDALGMALEHMIRAYMLKTTDLQRNTDGKESEAAFRKRSADYIEDAFGYVRKKMKEGEPIMPGLFMRARQHADLMAQSRQAQEGFNVTTEEITDRSGNKKKIDIREYANLSLTSPADVEKQKQLQDRMLHDLQPSLEAAQAQKFMNELLVKNAALKEQPNAKRMLESFVQQTLLLEMRDPIFALEARLTSHDYPGWDMPIKSPDAIHKATVIVGASSMLLETVQRESAALLMKNPLTTDDVAAALRTIGNILSFDVPRYEKAGQEKGADKAVSTSPEQYLDRLSLPWLLDHLKLPAFIREERTLSKQENLGKDLLIGRGAAPLSDSPSTFEINGDGEKIRFRFQDGKWEWQDTNNEAAWVSVEKRYYTIKDKNDLIGAQRLQRDEWNRIAKLLAGLSKPGAVNIENALKHEIQNSSPDIGTTEQKPYILSPEALPEVIRVKEGSLYLQSSMPGIRYHWRRYIADHSARETRSSGITADNNGKLIAIPVHKGWNFIEIELASQEGYFLKDAKKHRIYLEHTS